MEGGGGTAPCIVNLRTRQLCTQLHVLASFPVDKDTHIHWMGGWVGPGAGYLPLGELNLSPRSACRLVTMPSVYTYIHNHIWKFFIVTRSVRGFGCCIDESQADST
jgi:hypothetical protein